MSLKSLKIIGYAISALGAIASVAGSIVGGMQNKIQINDAAQKAVAEILKK